MRLFAGKYWRLSLVFFCLFSGTAAFCQEKEKLTVEWINGSEASAVSALPSLTWLNDNRCIVYDRLKAPEDRALEMLDPATGRRTALVDPARARASLKALLNDNMPKALPAPVEIERSGMRAAYLFDGDLFLLETKESRFVRLTKTPEDEKCVDFSPDGMKLSYVRDNNLFVYDIATGKEKPLTTDGNATRLNGTLSWVYWEEVFGRHDTGYWWSGDSKAIAYFQTDESGVSLQHYVDVEPWTPHVTTQRYPKVGQPNPVVRVGIVELASEKTTWLDFGEKRFEYVVRAQWLPDNRVSVQTLNRAQTELNLYFADRATGRTKPILKETDSAWVNVLDDLVFLRDGSGFLWGSERDGYEHLYMYDMSGNLRYRVTQGNWSIRAAGGEVAWLKGGVVGVNEKEGTVYFTALEKSSIEKHLYRIRLDGTGLERVTTGDGTHSITFNTDATMYIDRYSQAVLPPSLSIVDARSGRRVIVTPAKTALPAQVGLRYPEFFSIPARDGFPMPAQILKPATMEPGRKYPVIFYVYSGPSAPVVANAWQREIFWENLLLQNGYLVVRCDNRSATGISKTLETTVLHSLGGEGELNDLVDAARWMKTQPYVDSARIGIWGWSGGGTCTLLGMTRSTEFKAGIAVAGVTDFRFYDTKWAEQTMKTEVENKKGYDETALVGHAKNLHGKLLLVHGTHDDNVHIQNTWAFADELIASNKLFEMMIYPMRAHGIRDRRAQVHLYNTMLDFWRRNL